MDKPDVLKAWLETAPQLSLLDFLTENWWLEQKEIDKRWIRAKDHVLKAFQDAEKALKEDIAKWQAGHPDNLNLGTLNDKTRECLENTLSAEREDQKKRCDQLAEERRKALKDVEREFEQRHRDHRNLLRQTCENLSARRTAGQELQVATPDVALATTSTPAPAATISHLEGGSLANGPRTPLPANQTRSWPPRRDAATGAASGLLQQSKPTQPTPTPSVLQHPEPRRTLGGCGGGPPSQHSVPEPQHPVTSAGLARPGFDPTHSAVRTSQPPQGAGQFSSGDSFQVSQLNLQTGTSRSDESLQHLAGAGLQAPMLQNRPQISLVMQQINPLGFPADQTAQSKRKAENDSDSLRVQDQPKRVKSQTPPAPPRILPSQPLPSQLLHSQIRTAEITPSQPIPVQAAESEIVAHPGRAASLQTAPEPSLPPSLPVQEALAGQSRVPSKPSVAVRTITFDEVYQGGNPEYKHIIVEHKKRHYILRCDEHGVHFKKNPLAGAAKHLASAQHGTLSKEHALAIKKLGYLVVDATPEKVEMNNAMVNKAFDNGYKAFNANMLSKSERRSIGIPLKEVDGPRPKTPEDQEHGGNAQKTSTASITVSPRQVRPTAGITRPEPGELYLGYWAKEKRNYVIIMLPWFGSLGIAGISGTLGSLGLLRKAPRCFLIDKSKTPASITGWAPGFEDDGPMEGRREFPVMYFDKKDNRSVGWLQAKYISPFNYDDENKGKIPFFNDAIQHYEWWHKHPLEQETPLPVEGEGDESRVDGDLPPGPDSAMALDEPAKDDSGTSRASGDREVVAELPAVAVPRPLQQTPEAPMMSSSSQEDVPDQVMLDAPPVHENTESVRGSDIDKTDTGGDISRDTSESRRTSVSNRELETGTGTQEKPQTTTDAAKKPAGPIPTEGAGNAGNATPAASTPSTPASTIEAAPLSGTTALMRRTASQSQEPATRQGSLAVPDSRRANSADSGSPDVSSATELEAKEKTSQQPQASSGEVPANTPRQGSTVEGTSETSKSSVSQERNQTTAAENRRPLQSITVNQSGVQSQEPRVAHQAGNQRSSSVQVQRSQDLGSASGQWRAIRSSSLTGLGSSSHQPRESAPETQTAVQSKKGETNVPAQPAPSGPSRVNSVNASSATKKVAQSKPSETNIPAQSLSTVPSRVNSSTAASHTQTAIQSKAREANTPKQSASTGSSRANSITAASAKQTAIQAKAREANTPAQSASPGPSRANSIAAASKTQNAVQSKPSVASLPPKPASAGPASTGPASIGSAATGPASLPAKPASTKPASTGPSRVNPVTTAASRTQTPVQSRLSVSSLPAKPASTGPASTGPSRASPVTVASNSRPTTSLSALSSRDASPVQPKLSIGTTIKGDPSAPEQFDLFSYSDKKGISFQSEEGGSMLRLYDDTQTKRARSVDGAPISLSIDAMATKVVEVHPPEGDKCAVVLEYVNGDKATLVFGKSNVNGPSEFGRIHARRFCRCLMRTNRSIEYRNKSLDSGAR